MAGETSTNSGPWSIPDSYRKYNGVLRYTRGDNTNGFSLTAMGYRGRWNATEASPQRATSPQSAYSLNCTCWRSVMP